MLTSVRGAASAAMGAVAADALSRPAPTASIPRIPRRVGVIVDISEAGREAARRRASAPKLRRVNRQGGTGSTPHVQPQKLSLPDSDPLVPKRSYLGNEMMAEGTRASSKPGLLTSLARGETPLRRWSDRAPTQVFSEVPGSSIQKAADRNRSSSNLSNKIQRGIRPLGQWNSGSYASIRASRPGKAIADQGLKGRKSSSLSARIGKGERSLEVGFGRHIVRPDASRSAA